MSFKEKTLDFIKTSWQQKREKPSMREIARNLNVSTSKLYKNFTGKNEMYRLAGVPPDESSMQKTVSALKAKKKYAKAKKANHKTEDHYKANCYTLNLNQTDSLRGLCFVSGRKALHLVMDEILDFQHKIYKHKITLKKIRIISEFLDTAIDTGWKIKEEPNLINFITRLHNIGISDLDPSTVKDVLEIIVTIKKRGWSIDDFVKHVTSHYNQILYYNKYKSGQMSYQDFKKRIGKYI